MTKTFNRNILNKLSGFIIEIKNLYQQKRKKEKRRLDIIMYYVYFFNLRKILISMLLLRNTNFEKRLNENYRTICRDVVDN